MDPGASWKQTAGDAAGIEYPLVALQVYRRPVGEKGRDRGCLRLARLRWAAVAGSRRAGGTAATACSDGARLAAAVVAASTQEVDSLYP